MPKGTEAGDGASRPPPAGGDDPSSTRERIAAVKAAGQERMEDAQRWAEEQRARSPLVARGFDIAERDRRRLGGLLAGALAYRLFLWLLPAALLVVGLMGAVTGVEDDAVETAAEDVGLGGALTDVLQDAAHQSGWGFAIAIGLFGALYAGIGAIRALRVIHAAAWGLRPERMSRPIHASAALLLLSTGLLVVALLAGWARERSTAAGLLATLAMTGVFFVLWLRVSLWLPHPRLPVRAFVPGAVLVAVGVEALHFFTVYYLNDRAERAQSVYGAIGAALVLLLWLFILARLIVGAAMVNAELSRRSTGRAEPESAGGEQP